MAANFSDQDVHQLNAAGISLNEANRQLTLLRNAHQAVRITAPATVGNGILPQSVAEEAASRSPLLELIGKVDVVKFVPASGAATRMFKHLLSGEANHPLWKPFFSNWEKFAFLEEVPKLSSEREIVPFLKGNGWADMPKGLVPFHSYTEETRNAFQEQMLEAVSYLRVFGQPRIHFTVDPNFLQDIALSIDELKVRHGLSELEVSYSFQDRSTDTLAVQEDGTLVRTENGELLLRPGGHGSLLSNLDAIDADFVMLRNIDNVTRENHWQIQHKYQRGLLNLSIEIKQTVDRVLSTLAEHGSPEKEDIDALVNWSVLEREHDHNILMDLLDRPLRLVAVVPNVGEPGGGPFWTAKRGLQIVETAEIDLDSQDQASLVKDATHFNPVNLVCAKRRFDGTQYSLPDFVDNERCFVSSKSLGGRTIKVLEHPGLWNGAMGDWITVFVETPIETFNPVKTVNDLLRPAHQV